MPFPCVHADLLMAPIYVVLSVFVFNVWIPKEAERKMKEGEKKMSTGPGCHFRQRGGACNSGGRRNKNGPLRLCEQLGGQKPESPLSGAHDRFCPPELLQCVCGLFLAPVHSFPPWGEGRAGDGQLLLFPEPKLTEMNCNSASRPSPGSGKPSTDTRVPKWPHQTDPTSDASCQCARRLGGERVQRLLRRLCPGRCVCQPGSCCTLDLLLASHIRYMIYTCDTHMHTHTFLLFV